MSLQPSSRAVAERDPDLPGLKLLLDEAAIARHLGARTVTRVDLRYKPGVSCVAGLRVVGADWAEQWFCAKAFTAHRFEQIRQRNYWHSGRWRVHLIEEQMVALIPPQLDRKLKGLYKLLDPERGPGRLAKITGGTFGAPDLHILRYKPNRRLVAQVTDRGSERKALLKILPSATFEAARRGAAVARDLGGPEVLACDPKRGAITTRWLPGVSLCPVGGVASRSLLRLAGARIAQHHQVPSDLPVLPRRTEAHALSRIVADLSAILPDCSDALASIGRRAQAALAAQTCRTGLIHGDLSADQVIANGDALSIIDWDRAATGDQGRDIGSVLARLDMQWLTGLLTEAGADDLKSAFLEGYRDEYSLPDSYRVQHVCHLILLLTEPFRLQAGAWQDLTAAVITYIDTLLGSASDRLEDEALPHLGPALSAAIMGPLITEQTGLILTAPPVLARHKPGQRAIVRYDCQTADGQSRPLLGKMRRKGPDRRTPAIQMALRSAGLDGQGQTETGVPRVVEIDNDAGLWFMEQVPGLCLRDLQDDGDPLPFYRAGAALGHFHRSGVVPERSWSHDQELGVLTDALGKAEELLPGARPRIAELLAQAQDAMRKLPDYSPACVHRDFYPDQVIIDDGPVWLIDLDLVALSDPAIDVGNFLAHLAEYAIRRTGRPEAARPLEMAFLNGYRRTGFRLPNQSVETLRSVSLLRHIYISRRFRERHHTTAPLLGGHWLTASTV